MRGAMPKEARSQRRDEMVDWGGDSTSMNIYSTHSYRNGHSVPPSAMVAGRVMRRQGE